MGAIKTKGGKSLANPLLSSNAETGSESSSLMGMERTARLEAIATSSAILGTIGDPLRLSLLLTLAEGERWVGDLCTQFGEDQPAISHSLALLRDSGLVQLRRLGNRNLYSLRDRGLKVANSIRKIVPSAQAGKHRRVRTSPIDPTILDDVRGFIDDAEGWFHIPNPAFGGRKPVELLGTAEEPRLRDRIMAAKLGMFS